MASMNMQKVEYGYKISDKIHDSELTVKEMENILTLLGYDPNKYRLMTIRTFLATELNTFKKKGLSWSDINKYISFQFVANAIVDTGIVNLITLNKADKDFYGIAIHKKYYVKGFGNSIIGTARQIPDVLGIKGARGL